MNITELNKIFHIITTHTEHEGGYCDTGEDMDWSCRSKCIQLAVTRLRKAYENGEL